MSQLPSAHAGQSFGSRRIDFITVSGEVSSSDAGTGRVTDGDGVVHDVRLNERSSALASGDTATVLRVQSGPNRRSRPVAIINHSRNVWMRAAPDATTILGRSGVTRTLNWWLSVLALALVAIAAAWPALHSFLTELNSAMMAGVPSINVFAEIGAQLPGLASWRMETALSAGLFDAIVALGFVPMEQLTEWGLGIAVGALALVTFFARSWRLLYVPALALLCLVSGAILGNPVATLLMVAGAALLFLAGGFINRIRDGGRFNARIERLAEYVLRHPPVEGVRSSEPARTEAIAPEPLAAAVAATAIAAASAVAEGDNSEDESAVLIEDNAGPTEAGAAADPGERAANGEITARADADNAAEVDNSETVPDSEAVAGAETGPDVDDRAEIEIEAAPAHNSTSRVDSAPEVTDRAVTEAEATPEVDFTPEIESGEQDDLPSLEAVAAAAAVSDTERAGLSTAVATTPLDEERTMPVVAPPPMPARPDEAEAGATAPDEARKPADDAVEPVTEAPEVEGEVTDATMTTVPAPPVVPESEPAEDGEMAAAVDESEAESTGTVSAPAIEDPLIEDDHDPMMESANGDFAPGAPEVEIDREKSD